MEDLLRRLREHVTELSNSSTGFVHRSWFVKYHLEIVEKIALELCEKYPKADRDMVTVMAWMHDYGKVIDFDTQYTLTLTKGKEKLLEIGFPEEFVAKVISYIELMDQKMTIDLSGEDIPIEVKVVSSADGASHLVGPFYYLWWYEHADKPY